LNGKYRDKRRYLYLEHWVHAQSTTQEKDENSYFHTLLARDYHYAKQNTVMQSRGRNSGRRKLSISEKTCDALQKSNPTIESSIHTRFSSVPVRYSVLLMFAKYCTQQPRYCDFDS
jgi:hypothetical protein